MTELAEQIPLPMIKPGPQWRSGIWPSQLIKTAVELGYVVGSQPIADDQIQPASLDLRLGSEAYEIPASFLPGRRFRVREKLDGLYRHRIDLSGGATLRKNHVYIVQLQESLRLKKRMSAVANPKSSTGRLDVFARVIADFATEFDNIQGPYNGALWAEIAPRSFDVVVSEGSKLVQMRIRQGTPPSNDKYLRQLHEEIQLVREDPTGDTLQDIKDGAIAVKVDIEGDPISGLIGYKAKPSKTEVNVDKVGYYDWQDFWEPLFKPKERGLILDPNDFYILASKGWIVVPPNLAADMVAYDTLVGEFRVHYAGFFDPGFGYGVPGVEGTRAVLEVRSHEVPFMIEDGQIVGRLVYERLTEPSEKPYGSSIGSSYHRQGLTLAKQFKR